MTQSSPQQLYQALSNSDPNQLGALKELKNRIIGHDEEKEHYVKEGYIPRLIELLDDAHTSADAKREIFLIIGSFAYGSEDTVQSMIGFGVVPIVCRVLRLAVDADDYAFATIGLRILVTVIKASPSASDQFPHLEKSPEFIGLLDRLLSSPSTPQKTIQQTCRLITLLTPFTSPASTSPMFNSLSQSIVVRVSMLLRNFQQSGKIAPGLEVAVSALATVLSQENAKALLSSSVPETSASGTFKVSISSDKFLQGLVQLTRADEPEARLAAVELLTALLMHASADDAKKQLILQPLLPTLVPIFQPLPDNPRVSLVLGKICREDVQSSAMAVEVGLVKDISGIFKRVRIDNWRQSDLISANLCALAGIAKHRDSFRSEIIDNGILKLIVKIMIQNRDVVARANVAEAAAMLKIKIAACHLVRSLSRSVTLLRTSLASEEIVDGLVGMLTLSSADTPGILSEDLLEVRAAAMAALCNLILEFGPLQKTFIEKGLLDLIVEATYSPYPPLRLNGVWALKHVIFSAPRELKDTVLEKLTFAHLMELCQEYELEIQEQAMTFMRNLVCRNHQIVDRLLQDVGEEKLFGLIEEKLSSKSAQDVNSEVLVSTVYTLVHIAAGPESHRDLIAQRDGLLRRLLPLLTHDNAYLRVAIVWVIINLTWVEEADGSAIRTESCKDRARRISQVGFEPALKARTQDSVMDVRERTKVALFQIDGLLRDTSRHT